MHEYYPILKNSALFNNIDVKEYPSLFACLQARKQGFQGDDIIFLAGSNVSQIGIILEGTILVTKEDYQGNRTILASLGRGDLFGETFACAGVSKSPVTVVSISEAQVLFIDFKKIVQTCTTSCLYHARLIENMMGILAGKNIYLNNRVEILSARSIREKLIAYFSFMVQSHGQKSFQIPFDREGLADFLCVNRSALSREMGKMRDEGMIEFNKKDIIFHG